MKKTTTALTLTAVAAITSAMGGLGTIARADSFLAERSVLVHFEDLDTNTASGAGLLYNRLELAAATVCSDLAPRRSPALAAGYASCVRAALGNAIGKVGRPLLTECALAHGILPSGAPVKMKVARVQPE